MRRIIALALLGCMLLAASALAEDVPEIDTFMLEQSAMLTVRMRHIAESGAVTLMTSMPEILEAIDEVSGYAVDLPVRALVYQLDAELMADAMLRGVGLSPKQRMDEELRAWASRRMAAVIPSMLAGNAGSTALATASILSVGEGYVRPEAFDRDAVVVLYYEDVPYVSIITFSRNGEDTIGASAMFVPLSDALEALLTDDLSSLFDDMLIGYEGIITCTEYDAERLQALLVPAGE